MSQTSTHSTAFTPLHYYSRVSCCQKQARLDETCPARTTTASKKTPLLNTLSGRY